MSQTEIDIDKTIFTTLPSALGRTVVKSRLGAVPHWPDLVVSKYTEMYEKIPKAPAHDKAILEFLVKDADLSMEHADGSFMDHLQFCYEYSYNHYKSQSPRVLLLHSIMGVGTNYFPLKVEQVPKFKALLTEEEYKHIEAFPTILRLLQAGPLVDELDAMDKKRLDEIEGLEFFRVIDNAPLSLSKDDFWAQLNFHMIHALDFLPCEDWKREKGDNFIWGARALHGILTKAGQLQCTVDLDLKPAFPNMAVHGRQGCSLGTMIRDCAPAYVQLSLARKTIRDFSASIKHDLSYKLKFAN